MSPSECSYTLGGAPIVFYAPFSALAYLVDGRVDMDLLVKTVSIIGFIGHLLIGWGIGAFLCKHPAKWYVTLPLSLVLVIIPNIIIYGLA